MNDESRKEDMSKNQPLTERMFFALTPELKKKVYDRAKSMGLDGPGFARIALALAAERGLVFGPPPVTDDKVNDEPKTN